MRGRPLLYTSYEADQAILNTMTKKVMVLIFLGVLLLIPFQVVPGFDFLGEAAWLRLLSTVAIFVIGALGLNILLGLAGQVSLGHAFFMGVGAYVAAVLGSDPEGLRLGFGLPMWIWLPAAGIAAAGIGVAFGPAAVRVRGLYLAFVTLGLVFVGDYVFRNCSTSRVPSLEGRGAIDRLRFRWSVVRSHAVIRGQDVLFRTCIGDAVHAAGQELAADQGGSRLSVDS